MQAFAKVHQVVMAIQFVAYVEFGGPPALRGQRLEKMQALAYDDLAADRHTVAVIQALEAILREHAAGRPGSMVEVNAREGGLVLRRPGHPEPVVLYPGRV